MQEKGHHFHAAFVRDVLAIGQSGTFYSQALNTEAARSVDELAAVERALDEQGV